MELRELIPWRKREKIREPIPMEEGDPFYALYRDINRMFDDLFKRWDLEPFWMRERPFSPRVNVEETDDRIIVTAELPGVEEKDLKISISNDILTLSGEKKKEEKEEKEGCYRMECSYGAFSRSIPLPAEVNSDKAEARFKKGVLKVTLPKSKPSKTKRIEIKTD